MRMTRVEFFDEGTISSLQVNVNNFLSSMEKDPSFELIDVKHTSYNYGEDRKDYHTAMIIYKIA